MNTTSPSDVSEAYIALGANLGDREATLTQAIAELQKHPAIEVLRCSNLYETDPVGYLDQPCFLNMALALKTTLDPEQAALGNAGHRASARTGAQSPVWSTHGGS